MIVVRLKGGLGNQMFQYSAGRRLAERHETELKLDRRPLDVGEHRSFRLDAFQLEAVSISRSEVDGKLRSAHPIKRLLRPFNRDQGLERVEEQHFHFDPSILRRPDNVYLDGYWQSEKYFADISGTIRRDFRFRKTPSDRNRALLTEIGNARDSVSVHVRRGDYVTSPSASRTHGVCDLDYYERAGLTIREQAGGARFYLFSDEPDWARAHVRLLGPVTVIDHNGAESPEEDLRLMSACRHHVLANSTFSWWAAWLAERGGSIVIAPERWFRTEEHCDDDLIPCRWIRL